MDKRKPVAVMPPDICAVCLGAIPEAEGDEAAEELHTSLEVGNSLVLVHWRCRNQSQLGLVA